MSTKFKLSGITTQNFLAFLSLLGLLKTLQISEPNWAVRVFWKDNSPYLQVLEDKISEKDIIDAIVRGLKKVGNKMRFKIENLKLTSKEFEQLQEYIGVDIMAALGSDGSIKKNKDELIQTPLCMIFGSGHQLFLKNLKNATTVNSKCGIEIQKALFESWRYTELGSSDPKFRWDPKEYRSHAFLAKDPSNIKSTGIIGANRLAAVGFTVYSCVPTYHGLKTMGHSNKQTKDELLVWPIWNKALSLNAIIILLRQINMKKLNASHDDHNDVIQSLYKYGVERVMCATVFWDGKFKNIRYAERIG